MTSKWAMRRPALLAALTIVLAACGTGPSAAEVEGAWQLESGVYQGSDVLPPPSHPITLTLEGDVVSGTAACNGYGGRFELGPSGTFSVGDIAVTEMACMPIEIMDVETAFIAALRDATHVEVKDGLLGLHGPETDLTFVELPPVPTADLIDTLWILDGIVVGNAVSSVMGETATLQLFADGTLVGSTGCRSLSGDYTISGAEIQMTSLGAEGECANELHSQDSQVITVLEGGFSVTIEGDRLTISIRGNEALVYRTES